MCTDSEKLGNHPSSPANSPRKPQAHLQLSFQASPRQSIDHTLPFRYLHGMDGMSVQCGFVLGNHQGMATDPVKTGFSLAGEANAR